MNLSPLNFSGLIHRAQLPPEEKKTGHAIAIQLYECSHCGEQYDDESEAEDCCTEDDCERTDCPVCGVKCGGTRDASDCCLWKDFDAKTRWRMADAVDAGSTWAEQLSLVRR